MRELEQCCADTRRLTGADQTGMDTSQYISTPLYGVLRSIGFGEHRDVHYFQINALFWSMERLFGCYERIMSVLSMKRSERPFLEADIENFIIRFQVVLNDLAYIMRQLIPEKAQGIAGYKGGVHPRNREVSMSDMIEKISKKSDEYQEFVDVLNEASVWMLQLRDSRNKVIHYKAKVVLFESDSPEFAFLDAAEPKEKEMERTPDGGYRIITTPVERFINDQMKALHHFQHVTLVNAIRQYVHRTGIRIIEVGTDPRMSAIGVARFKRLNGYP